MVKNPPCNAGDAGSIPGKGTKISWAKSNLSPSPAPTEAHVPGSPRATVRESMCHTDSLKETLSSYERSTWSNEDPACHNEDAHSQINKYCFKKGKLNELLSWCRKASDKTQYPFLIKNLHRFRNRKKFFNLIKGVYPKNLQITAPLMMTDWVLLFLDGEWSKVSTLIISIQHFAWSSLQGNKEGGKN